MTDLERARLIYGVIRDFGWDVLWRSANPIPDDAWPIDIIANALAAARREGAEQERETAYWRGLEAGKGAALLDYQIGKAEGAEEMRERAGAATAFCCFECSRVIRALLLTPEEPT